MWICGKKEPGACAPGSFAENVYFLLYFLLSVLLLSDVVLLPAPREPDVVLEVLLLVVRDDARELPALPETPPLV